MSIIVTLHNNNSAWVVSNNSIVSRYIKFRSRSTFFAARENISYVTFVNDLCDKCIINSTCGPVYMFGDVGE